jgi:hypothetical protein
MNPTRARDFFFRVICFVPAFFLTMRPAFAHDALASFSDVWLARDTMEMTITMARSAAFLLIKDDKPGVDHVDTDTFAKARPKLLKQAANLSHLTLAGKEIAPTETDVQMTDENDVQFRFVYPRPAGGGKVRFEFPYLPKMVEGHLLTHAVWNENKTGLKTVELRVEEKSSTEVMLPAVSQGAVQVSTPQPMEKPQSKLTEPSPSP